MRLLIFGNSGSGKSTLARALSQHHSLEHLDLDSIVWEPGRVAIQRKGEAIAKSLDDFLRSHGDWIIEGCYGELVEVASAKCTQLIFLNPGLAACRQNNEQRPWEPHKYRSLADQNAMLAPLQEWVAGYYSRGGAWSYAFHRRLFDEHPGAKAEYNYLPDDVAVIGPFSSDGSIASL